ncbi:hypothetical protein [Flavobacterium columnare]|uniref:hypothetical protein n=1 Tax=Flavobacterium columnare TaxID=996 RepID=UPI003B9EF813
MKKLIFFGSHFMIFFVNAQSQTNSFSAGLSEGWKQTINEAKNIDIYEAGSPNPSLCSPTQGYSPNDNTAHEKEYSRGYRCGVEQAVKIIPILQKKLQKKIENKNYLKGLDVDLNTINGLDELSQLKRREINEIKNIGFPPQAENAKIQEIETKYLELENKFKSQESRKEAQQRENNSREEAIRREDYLYERMNKNKTHENLISYYNEQQKAQINFNNEMEKEANAIFSNSMNQLQMQIATANQNELRRRQKVANNFIETNKISLAEILKKYNNIPEKNFNLNLSGMYSCYLLEKKNFSFLNNQIATNVVPSLVKINENMVEGVFLYGKEKMDIISNYSLKNYKLSKGILNLDYNTTLIVVECFEKNNENLRYSFNAEESGYISLWTDNEKEDGKIVYIQELNKYGGIIREVSGELKYFKNKKNIIVDNLVKIPINPNNSLLFFGEPTKTIYGTFSLYPKMDKKYFLPLKANEHRIVEIKKYRE